MSREYHLGCIRDAIRIYKETHDAKMDAYLKDPLANSRVYAGMTGTANATMHIIEYHLDALEAENDTEVLDNE